MSNEYIRKKYFKIINNKDKRKTLDTINDEEITINVFHNGMHQNWYYDTKTNQFINLLSKKVIEFYNEGIILSKSTNNLSQKWKIVNGKIKSLLNNKYLTYNEKNPTNLYLTENNDKHEEIDPNQQWTLFYIEIDLKTLNEIERKKIEEKLDKHIKSNNKKKTLKIPESNKNIKISIDKLPPFGQYLTIQTWIKIKKFKQTEGFKPLFYLNNSIGLWIKPHVLELYTNKDFEVNYKVPLNEWFNVVLIYNYSNNMMQFFINAEIIFTIKINQYDIKTNKLIDSIEPNIFTIINNEYYNIGTLQISNYELNYIQFKENYNNSIYNDKNNIFKHELQAIKDKHTKLQKKYDLLKYSKCPPEKKCIKDTASDQVKLKNNNLYILKTEAEKKYELLLANIKKESELCTVKNNNLELDLKHKITNYNMK
jgi:hypothetical protein